VSLTKSDSSIDAAVMLRHTSNPDEDAFLAFCTTDVLPYTAMRGPLRLLQSAMIVALIQPMASQFIS
jgi:hypothetical protein